ncbi:MULTISPECIES: gephyrin-like molybdotransferase Glp [Corynebacterium]|mgnify:FL=1|uniref:Molybdopterin molybdenumtransferase n=1 Tax=Corynebacterium tuberculostearicum SK141 TaxID=553206 RepID=C6RB79_9CORY|nr:MULTISPECIES: gephyrin-like molybdotransferase Glp [Corynebacterium]EET76855.1 molybdenum cofactor synthesis domain protein [Corynebacterium tuberculostearicum SK141]MCG7459768.1 molybdopterin molybdotransferase MoeA [Corynebacterium tuberculostearicum]MCG7464017.1 molybdopterin molybdotransferase MoeA [Corynebacterium tuberculostearicum]MCG7467780.1 molybdopterin molybdotransferase MoeA [Corynebacterium sp. ACRPE]MDK7047706.1 molybdopterin molybdotransferase MoeA [Corynebacterium sp. UMB00
MRSVDDQLALVTDAATTPEPVRIGISNALGLMCAEQVQANQPLPGFPQAAIDGYAVRAVDIGGERGLRVRRHKDQEEQSAEGEEDADSPQPEVERSLPVVGEVPAGSKQPLRLQPKQAVRVYTGAPLPTLADAVLPLEWTDRGRKRVTAHRPVRSGDFVRRVGDDIQPGDVAVSSGTVLGPAQIGLLAAVGRSKVLVYPRPRITIISFGRELVDLDQEPALGQVFDVNSYSLAAAAREAGAEVHRVGIAEGEPRRIREALEKHIARSEVLVISGAVGGAGAEAIREILDDLGDVDTSRVAMHPGSVQGFGLVGEERIPTFLLPSNPVSALVVFEVYIRPLIRLALGKRNAHRRVVRARALNHIDSRPGRRGFIRARLMRDAETADYLVEGLGGAAGAPAHLLAGLSEANAMIRVPEEVTEIRPGDVVDVLFLTQRS